MTAPIPGSAENAPAPDGGEGAARHRFPPWLPLLLVLLVGAAAVAAVVAATVARPTAAGAPTDESADAGFARDMSTHHAQAVEMAMTVLGRTDDPAIRTLATDIVLTQQAQIGIMRGWLDVWGLPPTGWGPRMAWMGMPMDGPMPGMATAEEVASLAALPPAAADRRFLELMIRHHQGGIDMARAGLERGGQTVVRRFAQAVLTGQQAEIEAMEDLLRRGSAAVAIPALPPPPVLGSGAPPVD